MAGETGDLLDGDSGIRNQGNEIGRQLAWRPVVADLRGPADRPELAADVGGIKGRPAASGEDQIAVCSGGTTRAALSGLLFLVGLQRADGDLRQRQSAA